MEKQISAYSVASISSSFQLRIEYREALAVIDRDYIEDIIIH